MKSFKISEKRETNITRTVGPGEYDPDRANSQIKPKNRAVNIGSSPERPDNFNSGVNANLGPGQYDSRDYTVKSTTKSFTIGEKRARNVDETMGPGSYDPSRADGVTKHKVPSVDMGKSPSRPDRIGQTLVPSSFNAESYSSVKPKAKRSDALYESLKPKQNGLMQPVRQSSAMKSSVKKTSHRRTSTAMTTSKQK